MKAHIFKIIACCLMALMVHPATAQDSDARMDSLRKKVQEQEAALRKTREEYYQARQREIAKRTEESVRRATEAAEKAARASSKAVVATFGNNDYTLNIFETKDRDNEVTKLISDKYKASASTILDLTNKYGEVAINTWDKNEITVDVTIKAWGSTEEKARKLLDMITIQKSDMGDMIRYITEVNNINTSNGWNLKGGFEINYKVNMPKTIGLTLRNRYGAVYLGDFSGNLDLELGYGGLTAQRITSARADISVKYGSASIEELRKGKVDFKYQKSSKIHKAGVIEISNAYGPLDIGEAAEVTGSCRYGNIDIDMLTKRAILSVGYGSADIDRTGADVEEIELNLSYSSGDITFDRKAHFNYEVDTSYGSFSNMLSDVENNREVKKGYTGANYQGVRGKASTSRVYIKTSYGSVTMR